MGAIDVTAETLLIGGPVDTFGFDPKEDRSTRSSTASAKAHSDNIQGHPPHQVRSRIGNWWDGLFRISRKETAPNEHRS